MTTPSFAGGKTYAQMIGSYGNGTFPDPEDYRPAAGQSWINAGTDLCTGADMVVAGLDYAVDEIAEIKDGTITEANYRKRNCYDFFDELRGANPTIGFAEES